jgi:peptidoglycan hydrolase CwlO-like protein
MDFHMRGQQLHDKATRGETLTMEEQHELEQWYAQEDGIEAALLQVATINDTDPNIQRQVQAILDQLRIVIRQIHELSTENDVIRREITDLQHRLAKHPTTRAA